MSTMQAARWIVRGAAVVSWRPVTVLAYVAAVPAVCLFLLAGALKDGAARG